MQLRKDTNCEKHDLDKKYFCEDEGCQEALCPECYYENHTGHPKKLLKTIYQEKKREVQDVLEDLGVTIKEFENRKDEMRDKVNEIEKEAEELKDDHQEFNALVEEAIDAEKKKNVGLI